MIAVVVPSNRPEQLEKFCEAWKGVFTRHGVILLRVIDGNSPHVIVNLEGKDEYKLSWNYAVDHGWDKVLFNHTDAIRNFGTLAALQLGADRIMTVDDDVTPWNDNDPIQGHLDVLGGKCPLSWYPVGNMFTRGFPYGVRKEAEVWLSHGVWVGVPDYDGPTQLVVGPIPMEYTRGVIPRGCLFPCSGMNLMWKAEASPFMYYAPMGKKLGVQRFADIFMGVYMKRMFDSLGKAVVTGYSTVYHTRASNVFNNLEEEAKGIRWHESWWNPSVPMPEDAKEYFALYNECRGLWSGIVRSILDRKNP